MGSEAVLSEKIANVDIRISQGGQCEVMSVLMQSLPLLYVPLE